jgi:hypothetical protein
VPKSKRFYWAVGFLVVLAVLAVVAIVVGDDDDEDAATPATTTSTTLHPVAPTDEEIASTLLPAVSALGSDWVETQRDDVATPVEPTAAGPCPAGPIPEGYLTRSEQQRVRGGAVMETLSVTAGVVPEGAAGFDLDDEAVIACLRDGLQESVPDTSTVTVADDIAIGPLDPGAEVTHQRLEVSGSEPGVGGTFDFVLVRRGRLVSLGLLTGFDAEQATDLTAVATVLDDPLQSAAAQID